MPHVQQIFSQYYNGCFFLYIYNCCLCPFNVECICRAKWQFSHLEGLMRTQVKAILNSCPTHWKRPWCWERLRAGGEGGDRGNGWMVSQTQWTWGWANSRRQWRTGKPGVLQSTGSQRVGHNWVTATTSPCESESFR